jgi:G3E family GTPase
LIEASSEDVVLLPGGCVCCQVRADLAEALLRLERGVARGDIPGFQRIVIETSGLAEPGPILQLFAESPALAGRYRLGAVVTVVDAVLGGTALAEEGTAYRQALLADRLVISKSQDAPAAGLTALDAALAALNPHAERVHALPVEARPEWFSPLDLAGVRVVPAESLRAAHDEAITSFVLQWDAPQPLAAIGEWLHGLAGNFGARLLRVKGIVSVEEDAHAVALHAIQHLVSPPEFLAVPGSGSRVVFITRGLEPGDVRPSWPCAAGAAPSPPPSTTGSRLLRPLATGAFSGAAARR